MTLQQFVQQKRKSLSMTQPELAERAGVGLRFIRELEQGKETLRMDKVNLVLRLFGQELGPVPAQRTRPAGSEARGGVGNVGDGDAER
jgi:y4mF family transcriptional regulator